MPDFNNKFIQKENLDLEMTEYVKVLEPRRNLYKNISIKETITWVVSIIAVCFAFFLNFGFSVSYTILITFTLFTIILWYLLVRFKDRKEPEPAWLSRTVFLVGFFSIIVALILYYILGEFFDFDIAKVPAQKIFLFSLAVAMAGPVEELAKFLIIRFTVYESKEFNQIFDGIFYGVIVALAFSLGENLNYLISPLLYGGYGLDTSTALIRATITTLVHVTSTGICGLYLGKAKFYHKNKRLGLMAKGLLIAAVIHGLFNFSLGFDPFGIYISGLIVIISFGLFYSLWNSDEFNAVWKHKTDLNSN